MESINSGSESVGCSTGWYCNSGESTDSFGESVYSDNVIINESSLKKNTSNRNSELKQQLEDLKEELALVKQIHDLQEEIDGYKRR